MGIGYFEIAKLNKIFVHEIQLGSKLKKVRFTNSKA